MYKRQLHARGTVHQSQVVRRKHPSSKPNRTPAYIGTLPPTVLARTCDVLGTNRVFPRREHPSSKLVKFTRPYMNIYTFLPNELPDEQPMVWHQLYTPHDTHNACAAPLKLREPVDRNVRNHTPIHTKTLIHSSITMHINALLSLSHVHATHALIE